MINAFVYKWTDILTNKIYIGYHKGHVNDGYVCSSKYMMPEYKKRPHDFIREILLFDTVENCFNYEQSLIKKMFEDKTPCYNKGLSGIFIIDDETRKKLSERQLGNKNHRYGKPITEKHKQAIKDFYKTYKCSDESRLNYSLSKKGEKHHFYGKNLSNEHKAKLSKITITSMGIFASASLAAFYHKVDNATITNWVKSGRAEFA